MQERLFLQLQGVCFSKNNILKTFLTLMVVFIPFSAFMYINNYIDIEILNNIISSDMFSVSGVLAGFVFTGLSFIVVSDSEMIKRLKETNNYINIKNLYIYSILSFVGVMMLYLIKPIILSQNILDNLMNLNEVLKILIPVYLFIMLFLFIFGSVLFLLCLFILSKRINE